MLAPTPPLVITQNDMNEMSFLSPTNVEPTSSCDAPSTFTIIAASFQNEHRHVTPMPHGVFSPEESLNMMSDSQKDIDTSGNSVNKITDTTDMKRSNQSTDTTLASTSPAITSGKSMDNTVAELLARHMYNESTLFPVIVHRMLAEASKKYDRSLMHWSECGEFFWIGQKHSMLSSVLGKYFKRTFWVVSLF